MLYRLLYGNQAQMIRQIATRDSRTAQVVGTIRWIREHYAKPFRAVTAMSPLQYQQQVRLQEAQLCRCSSLRPV